MSQITRIREMLHEAIELWGFDDIVTKMLSQRLNEEINKEQLKDLIEDRKAFCVGDYVPALEYAIKELEKTDPEVPVQEQHDINFNPNTGEKLYETCPRCWVKRNQPFNCGFDICPGYKLFNPLLIGDKSKRRE